MTATGLGMALQSDKEPIVLKFGGGLNEQTEDTKINPLECVKGKNFELDFQKRLFRRRRSFTLVASAPNGLGLFGGAQLIKSDNTRSFLIQAGNSIYEWDGASGSGGMTLIANVSGAARLRGQIEANSVKDDKVLIADLALVETVKTWDGTTFAALSHGLGSDFKARYATIDNERAYFANVSAGTATPHLLVAGKRDDFTTLSTTDRPSSSLGAGDAWFLPIQDLKPINGLVAAFGEVILSTRGGSFYRLTGGDNPTTDKVDAKLDLLISNAQTSGDEGVAVVGNRIVYGAQGRVDAVTDTDRFGDIEVDDLSRWLEVANVPDWTLTYSPRWKKLYAVPSGGGKVHVMNKSILEAGLPFSPWSIWDTDDTFNFEPTFQMLMLNPVDGLEYCYMGDGLGNLYQLEANSGQDPNSNSVVAERTSGVLEIPPAEIYDIDGWVRYSKTFGGTLTLTFEFGGENVFDESITVTLKSADNAPVFGGSFYFGGDNYFNLSFDGRLTRSRFGRVPGRSSQVQIKASYTGTADFAIEEIGVQIGAAT